MREFKIMSEITGTVWKIKVKPGDAVNEGDTIMIVESMKMEIPLICESNGIMKEILVCENDSVSDGQVVASMMY